MLKRNKRILLIFVSLAGIISLLVAGYISGFFYFLGITHFQPSVSIVAFTTDAWIDTNENGTFDNGEEPLINVWTSYFDGRNFYGGYGQQGSEFIPGCIYKCWNGKYIDVSIPQGFRPTTPTRVYLSSNMTHARFGFVPTNP